MRESSRAVDVGALIESWRAWENKQVSVIGLFEYHADEPRLRELESDSTDALSAARIVLEFDDDTNPMEIYSNLDREIVLVQGRFHCVKRQEKCVLPFIVDFTVSPYKE